MKRTGLCMLVALVVAFCLAPFAWQVVTSLKSSEEIIQMPPTYVPDSVTAEHYRALFVRKPFGRYLWNSFFVSAVSTFVCVGVSAMAAYAIARLRVKGSTLILAGLVAVSLFPPIVFFFPLYELVRVLGLTNHPLSLIVPYVAFNLPFTILILSAFFRTVPPDIEEAAKVDGFSRWQILTHIIVPLSAPALATTAILVFIFCWNEFLFALSFAQADEAKTVTAGIASLSGGSQFEIPWGPISASVVVSTLPLIVLVLLFQRRIIQGLTSGAAKG